MHKRPIFDVILKRLQEPRHVIQVLIGPRQVGKTTMAKQIVQMLDRPLHYVTADLNVLCDGAWIEEQWNIARGMVVKDKGAVLIMDEIQKIHLWSSYVKAFWDADTMHDVNLTVVILGSSPWLMQKGLTESLAGRFELIPVMHWSFTEMETCFGWLLEKYIYYGGYPGAIPFIDEKEPSRWVNYINDALIETTISRDIVSMIQVNKPALLRQLFQLGCIYSGQMLSYTKILGQLQDSGNTTTLANYLDLLSRAGLLAGLQKFANQVVRQRGSSPKFAVFNTALMTAQSNKTFKEAREDREFWGRLVESAVGAHLLNGIRGTQMELFYWRDGDAEVDFVLKRGDKIMAIEVKSGVGQVRQSGMDQFVKEFKPTRVLLVGEQGMSVEDFLRSDVKNLI